MDYLVKECTVFQFFCGVFRCAPHSQVRPRLCQPLADLPCAALPKPILVRAEIRVLLFMTGVDIQSIEYHLRMMNLTVPLYSLSGRNGDAGCSSCTPGSVEVEAELAIKSELRDVGEIPAAEGERTPGRRRQERLGPLPPYPNAVRPKVVPHALQRRSSCSQSSM